MPMPPTMIFSLGGGTPFLPSPWPGMNAGSATSPAAWAAVVRNRRRETRGCERRGGWCDIAVSLSRSLLRNGWERTRKDNLLAGSVAWTAQRKDHSACFRICVHLELVAGTCQPFSPCGGYFWISARHRTGTIGGARRVLWFSWHGHGHNRAQNCFFARTSVRQRSGVVERGGGGRGHRRREVSTSRTPTRR